MNQTPESRKLATVDIGRGMVGVCELAVKGIVQPAFNNLPLWDCGLGDVVDELVHGAGIPRGPMPVVDLARKVGILKRAKK